MSPHTPSIDPKMNQIQDRSETLGICLVCQNASFSDRFTYAICQFLWPMARFVLRTTVTRKPVIKPRMMVSYRVVVLQLTQCRVGGVVNDYVPFYFSPKTGFTFTIAQENVGLRCPDGAYLRQATDDDRAFFVGRAKHLIQSHLTTYFSDVALNTLATPPTIRHSLAHLKTTVAWRLFDEEPLVADIAEIGYDGVCRWLHDRERPAWQQNRKAQRMAEFLVRDAVPIAELECLVVKTNADGKYARTVLQNSGVNFPVYVKPGCFY